MRRTRTSSLVAAVLVTVSLGLGACGGDDDKEGSAAPAPKAYNQTDVAFAADMTPHHKEGVELGKLAVEKGVNPQVKSLGRDIVEAQTREAETLMGFLGTFGDVEPAMSAAIEERGMAGMAKLEKVSGAAFDKLWLDVIGGHHASAIQMANIEKAGGRYPQAKQLAEAIISTQTRELTQFNKLSAGME